MCLNQFNLDIHLKLNKFETNIITLFREASPLYVIIALLGIVLLNGLGFRDIFGFTNFFIIVISKFLHNDTKIQIFISIIISGIFMALEKLIRYYYFSTEIQFLLSKPFEIILCCLKWITNNILCCFKDVDFSFLTTKYLILISKYTKDKQKLNIIYNFRNKFTKYKIINKIISIIISIIWLTFSEWISPFQELILFIHNWNLNWNNILLLIFSEFFDIDNIIEIILIIKSFDEGNILETRFLMIIIGIMFSIIGYVIFFIPTLYWIRKYYYEEIHEEERFF